MVNDLMNIKQEENIASKLGEKEDHSFKMFKSGKLESTCTNKKQISIVIILFIVSLYRATTTYSSNVNTTQQKQLRHDHNPYQQPNNHRNSLSANQTGATNSSSSRLNETTHVNYLWKKTSSRNRIDSVFSQQARGLIDHYVDCRDYGKLLSLGFFQLIRMMFDDDERVHFKLPNDLSADVDWLSHKYLDSMGASFVDYLSSTQPSAKMREKREANVDEVEMLDNGTAAIKLPEVDKDLHQQVIKSVNPKPKLETNMRLQQMEPNQDYLYDDLVAPKNKSLMSGSSSRTNKSNRYKSTKSNPTKHSRTTPPAPEPAVETDHPSASMTPPTILPDQSDDHNADSAFTSSFADQALELGLQNSPPITNHEDSQYNESYSHDAGIITPTAFSPLIGTRAHKSTRVARNRLNNHLQLPETSPNTTPNYLNAASTQVPAPEQNPLKMRNYRDESKEGDDFTPIETNHEANHHRGQVDHEDSTVPQVGDSSVLDESGKKQQQQQQQQHNRFSRMAELLNSEKQQLRQIKKLLEQNGLTSIAAKGSKRQSHSGGGEFSPMLNPKGSSMQPIMSEPLDEPKLMPPADMIRTNAPYAVIDPNIRPTGNENNFRQVSLQQRSNEQQISTEFPAVNSGHGFRGISGRFSPTQLFYSLQSKTSQPRPATKQRMASEMPNIHDFFGGTNIVKHNKRAINTDGQHQMQPQIFTYKDSTNNRYVTNKLGESESKQYAVHNGQHINQRPLMMRNPVTQSNYMDTNSVRENQNDQYSVPSVGPQGQVLGVLQAAPPIINSQNVAMLRPQAFSPNGHSQATLRMPVIPASSYILPSFSTTTSHSTANPFKYSRPLSNNNLSNSNQGAHQPSRALNAAYQHRIGRVASSSSSYDEAGAQASVPHTSTSDPMWSDTQNQEDDYQQSPQTIQITAVPNGGFVGNGFNALNGLNGLGFNGLAGLNALNGWGGGPWNGRQVLLVNRQPQVGTEWRSWMLPVAIILALPLILGALFVPVFLKSVMFLIQILQMLGLLMPPSQLAAHLTAGSHSQQSG